MQHTHCQRPCPSSRAPQRAWGRTQTLGAFRDPPAEKSLTNYSTREAQCVARSWSCSLGLQQRVHLARQVAQFQFKTHTYEVFNKKLKKGPSSLCVWVLKPHVLRADSSSSSSAKASSAAGLQPGMESQGPPNLPEPLRLHLTALFFIFKRKKKFFSELQMISQAAGPCIPSG